MWLLVFHVTIIHVLTILTLCQLKTWNIERQIQASYLFISSILLVNAVSGSSMDKRTWQHLRNNYKSRHINVQSVYYLFHLKRIMYLTNQTSKKMLYHI